MKDLETVTNEFVFIKNSDDRAEIDREQTAEIRALDPNSPYYASRVREIVEKANKKINSIKEKTVPSNCPPDVLDAYNVLGIYPVVKLFKWNFDENPLFDWKGLWEKKCGLPDGSIDIDETINKLDKMQRDNFSNIPTGATELLGYIGQKLIREGKVDTASNIYEKLLGFVSFLDTVIDKDEKCASECKLNQGIVFENIGRLVTATVESGLAKNHVPDSFTGQPSRDDFVKDPYVSGMKTLFTCMIESEGGSEKQDACLSAISNIMTSGILSSNFVPFDDVFRHVNKYDDVNDLKTWVNATISKAGSLVKVLDEENKRDAKFSMIDDRTGENIDPVHRLIVDGLQFQLKETCDEFSSAEWMAENILEIGAMEGNFTRHDEIINAIYDVPVPIGSQEGCYRISIWNGWLDKYVNGECKPEDASCVEKRKKAFNELGRVLNDRCIIPIQGMTDRTNLFDKSLEDCKKALSNITKMA